jgi:hypothetical protein
MRVFITFLGLGISEKCADMDAEMPLMISSLFFGFLNMLFPLGKIR